MSKNIGEIDYTEEERLNLGAILKKIMMKMLLVGGPSEIHIMQTKTNKKKGGKRN